MLPQSLATQAVMRQKELKFYHFIVAYF